MIPTTPCTPWDGRHRSHDGRPVLGNQYAYRMLWQEANGPLTPDIVLHHLCENEWCVNIEHLNPITQGQHLAEHGLTGDWGQSEKTHCPKNHPYDEDNTYTHHRKDGRIERHCRECVRDAKRRYRERQRNAS